MAKPELQIEQRVSRLEDALLAITSWKEFSDGQRQQVMDILEGKVVETEHE